MSSLSRILQAASSTSRVIVPPNFDIANKTFEAEFSFGGETFRVGAVVFNNDGTKMFTTNYDNNTWFQYNLTTAWDVSTASYSSISSVLLGGNDGWFSEDGLRFWVSRPSQIHEYVSSTSFGDINTYSFVQSSPVLSIGANNFRFSDDGSKLYISYRLNSSVPIAIYSLTTPYDVSSMATDPDSTINLLGFYDQGLVFNSNGTKLYVVDAGNDAVRQYSLDPPYDVSTAVFDNISTNAGTGGPTGIWFKPDGTRMYISDNTNNRVLQYNTTSA